MKKLATTLILTLFLGVSISCETNIVSLNKNKGGVIFTFDDAWVDEWYNARQLFDKYNIKVTFFVNRPQLLSADQQKKLLELQEEGHEIACHGYNHKDVLLYKDSLDALLTNEIIPAKEILIKTGCNINAYAYPFGNSNAKIDSLLLNHFSYLRKATYNINDTTLDGYNEIFVSSAAQRFFNSMGIDYNYHITAESFAKGLQRACKNNEVLVLYAHRIDTAHANYRVSEAYLEEFFKMVNEYQVQSIRVSDLKDFFTN